MTDSIRTAVQSGRDFSTLAAHVLAIMAEISEGKRAKSGEGPCPVCKGGTIRWAHNGPRAFRLACSTPDCLQALS